jgi:hypothetical protein
MTGVHGRSLPQFGAASCHVVQERPAEFNTTAGPICR